MKLTRSVAYFILSFCFFSCSDDIRRRATIDSTGQEQVTSDFSTRLAPNLMISGVNCDGNQSTTYQGVNYDCNEGNWLISIDNINLCDGEGPCGEEIVPFVATLSSSPDSSENFFRIVPESPTTEDYENILNRVWVRFDENGTAEVVEQ